MKRKTDQLPWWLRDIYPQFESEFKPQIEQLSQAITQWLIDHADQVDQRHIYSDYGNAMLTKLLQQCDIKRAGMNADNHLGGIKSLAKKAKLEEEKQSRGLLHISEYIEKYKIKSKLFWQLYKAGSVKTIELQSHYNYIGSRDRTNHYLPDKPISQDILDTILLTKYDAAEYLGVSVLEFEKMRKKAGIKPAGKYHSRKSNWPMNMYLLGDVKGINDAS